MNETAWIPHHLSAGRCFNPTEQAGAITGWAFCFAQNEAVLAITVRHQHNDETAAGHSQ